MGSIFESHLVKWLNDHSEFLPLILVVAISIPIFRFITEVLKSIEYFYPRRDSKIKQKSKHLSLSKSLGDSTLARIIENSLKDDLFILSTGIYFSGEMREKFLELYPTISNKLPLH